MGKIKLPPPKTKTTAKGSAYQQFINYWVAHGYKALTGQLAASIFSVAKAEHLDPVTFAALILNETGGHHINPHTGKINTSAAGAIGIGQLMPSSFIGPHAFNGGVLPWLPKHKITLADLRDPGINMRLAAAYFGYLQGHYPDSAYGHYNAGPNAPEAAAAAIQQAWYAKWVTKWNPKYVSQTSATAPPGKAGAQVPGGTAPQTPDIPIFKDPFVAGVDKHGKLVTTFNPLKAMQYDGAPVTRSAFETLKNQYTSHYVSYTGQRPSAKQISNFIQKGWSDYQLDVLLSKSKNFKNSPIYKQYQTNYSASLKDLLPNGAKVPDELLRQAVVNQWTADALAAKVRKLPAYLKSNEFKGNVTTLMNVYSSIMGNPASDTQVAMTSIRDAALAGWSADQFAAFLRGHENYSQSTEYQSKALSVLGALGLITGSRAVLKEGVTPGPGDIPRNTAGDLFADPRVKGVPNQKYDTPLAGLGATLG